MSKKSKPNGKAGRARQPKKAVGHDKRVSALGKRREAIPAAIRSAPDRIRGLKPAYDGTPNMPATDAPESTPELLDGPILIDNDLAPGQLRELAELHADVQRAEAIYNEKADAAKTAKKTVESKTEFLLERLRAFTHEPSLPLFDERNESRAVTEMIEGGPALKFDNEAFEAAGKETDATT